MRPWMIWISCGLTLACTPTAAPGPGRPTPPSNPTWPVDAGYPSPTPPPPPTGAEVCANGLDEDLDTRVDESCPCSPGATQACFTGDGSLIGTGVCQAGTQTCEPAEEFGGLWGPCLGEVGPSAEVCDTLDNDCNGILDDAPAGCGTTPPPPPPPPTCESATDLSPTYVGERRTVTGTTCGGPDRAAVSCAGGAGPEAFYTWTSPDEPYAVTWTVSPGFVVGIAQFEDACGPGPFYCEYEDLGDWAHIHTLVVERQGGGCGEFTLTVTRER